MKCRTGYRESNNKIKYKHITISLLFKKKLTPWYNKKKLIDFYITIIGLEKEGIQ